MRLQPEVAPPLGDNYRHVSVAAQGSKLVRFEASGNGVVARLYFMNF